MLHKKEAISNSTYPEGWTGDMYRDDWYSVLLDVKDEIDTNLDKIHFQETEWINKKLDLLN